MANQKQSKHHPQPAASYVPASPRPPGGDDRPNDVTIFGCTGNAGRAVAFHVIRSAVQQEQEGGPQRTRRIVGLAGRNRDRVQQTLEGIYAELGISSSSEDEGDGGLAGVNIIVADASDPTSMLSMCQSSRVVVSCAGPYGRYGESTVGACIDGGAHYVDITGEVPWVSRMISEYGSKAEERGVALLPFSGYDCVPAEMGMYLAGKALERAAGGDDDGAMRMGQLNLAFRNEGGGFPRGTLETILDGFDGTAPERKDGDVRFYPKEYRAVAKTALSPLGFLLPKWSAHLGTYTGPNFMAGINVPVLCRAAPTFGFPGGDLVGISDRSVVSGKPSFLNVWGLLPTQLYIGALVAAGLALALPPFRWWLRNNLKTYSYGGDALGKVVMDADAVSAKKGVAGRKAATASARLVVPGDAGIYATGLFAAGVANALLEATTTSGGGGGPNSCSPPPAGFHSPVAALHGCRRGLVVDHLRKLGAEVSVEVTPSGGGEAKVLDAEKL